MTAPRHQMNPDPMPPPPQQRPMSFQAVHSSRMPYFDDMSGQAMHPAVTYTPMACTPNRYANEEQAGSSDRDSLRELMLNVVATCLDQRR